MTVRAGSPSPASPASPAAPASPFSPPTLLWAGDEPQLVPAGRADIVITPYRGDAADTAGVLALCNAPEVGKWAHRRAYPFREEHARSRFEAEVPVQAAAVARLRDGAPPETSPWSVIRDRASGRYIGDLSVRPDRYGFGGWEIAYSLHPDWHRRGVATAALGAVLAWARAAMGVEDVVASAQTTNRASSALLARLGFKVVAVQMVPWPADKGGGDREAATWRLEWPADKGRGERGERDGATRPLE